MNPDPAPPRQNPSEITPPPLPPPPLPPAPRDKGRAGKKLTGWWIAGLIVMIASCMVGSLLNARASVTNIAYAIGLVIGGLLFPALITALFAIPAYFRKAPRRLALVAMIAFGVCGLATCNSHMQNRKSGHAAADAMLEESRELRRQLVRTDDPDEREAISERAEALLKNAADKMPPGRAAGEMRALTKFIEPLFDQRRALNAASREFFGDDNDWTKYATTQRESLALGRERLARLRHAAGMVRQTMDELLEKASTMIKNNDTSLGISVEAFRGFCSSYEARSQKLKGVEESQDKIYVRIDDALAMLQAEWGNWGKRSDGVILWEDDELLEKFNTISRDIGALGAQLNDRQKALFQ